MKNTNKKEISEKYAILTIIRLFVSYGILISFLFSAIAIILIQLTNNVTFSNELIFRTSISLILSIFIYVFLHLICKLSNLDLLRKYKLKKEKEPYLCKKMNLFYLLCALFFVLLTITILYFDFSNELSQIDLACKQHFEGISLTDENLAHAFVNNYKESALKEFHYNQKMTLVVSIILELGMVYSFISLIPYQKKMLDIYNKS